MSTAAPQPPTLGSPPQPAPFTIVPTCPELDLSLPLIPASPPPFPAPPPPCRASPPSSLVTGAACQQVRCRREITVIAEPSNNTPPQHSNSHLEGKHHHGAKEKARSEERGLVLSDGAELNSTLALRAELQELAGAQFNSQKAVQQQLKSSRTRDSISSRATEAVNVPPSQQLYRALVSISVEEELLINNALHDRLQLVLPTRVIGCKKEVGPELRVFVRAEQRREKPLLPGLDQAMPCPQPTTCPAHSTFDLYHRHACWGVGL
ncbi:protein phosphatase 1 regulatory subunit 35 isoform X2 [Hypomesus transpacificus]|uniref:protein phosphatase 1 regulatory subunit 35 isoform X2 n=1 Tax=Hypomesus transpacificus TaxID=137520 RepID=UPI001F076828|nr:protein phosphatase 1 regulatory subunit 35 isoform X2 [Hypomesus transpacificus]